jgi:sarcosine oxidase subunit beta
MHNYDVIIIGAGSIGIPSAMTLAKSKIKVLILDKNSSPGQGENKKAIGGIRATHSTPAKILIANHSLKIFSNWKKNYDVNIDWDKGGYIFPVYRKKEKDILTSLLPIQKEFNLKINFLDSNEIIKILPQINKKNLIGGTYSPDDGSASPLLSINAFTNEAIRRKVHIKFKETVKNIIIKNNKIIGIETDKEKYYSPIIIDAAGINSQKLFNVKVFPELHEAAITEPIKRLFNCMIVDLREDLNSKNFYLYQNPHGQIIFCITPDPPCIGTKANETSTFLPQACSRIIDLIPELCTVRVRRMWRGCYPMTPDGAPIVGWNNKIKGLFHATGMCGQGFMLGPGIGEFICRSINQTYIEGDDVIKKSFSPKRKFEEKIEKLK